MPVQQTGRAQHGRIWRRQRLRRRHDEPVRTEPEIRYFLTGVGIDDFPCAPPKGKAGATGLVLSFLGFFCSRLLRICPLAISGLLNVCAGDCDGWYTQSPQGQTVQWQAGFSLKIDIARAEAYIEFAFDLKASSGGT